MNLLIIGRPGIRIFQELRKSETAWHALSFYDPIDISVGILVPVSSLSAALSLASDLKYFIRKLGSDHLFMVAPGVCCTAAVAKGRYHTRDDLPDPWPWKLWYWAAGDGSVRHYEKFPQICVLDGNVTQGGYVFEVLCSEEEFRVYRYTNPET